MIKKVTFHPSRIGCPSIPAQMMGMIRSLPGTIDVSVRYDDRSLDVTFDDTKLSPADIIKKVGQELGLALWVGAPGGRLKGDVSETCPM
ncbi:MAG: hypothetical protein AAB699_01920 [Patescibacteria group bacterium]